MIATKNGVGKRIEIKRSRSYFNTAIKMKATKKWTKKATKMKAMRKKATKKKATKMKAMRKKATKKKATKKKATKKKVNLYLWCNLIQTDFVAFLYLSCIS
jgi:hypothetical protein